MGLKKGKYVYVEVDNNTYVKVRVFKSKSDESPDKYMVVGPVVKKPPYTAKILKLEDMPSGVAAKIKEYFYGSRF